MMTKPLTRRLWLETADRARSMLNARPQYGEKLVLQRAAADRLGLKMTTLRTYLDGLATIEEVEKADRALGANLRTRSVDAVRAIGRWMRNDRASALGFVRDNPAFSAADVARAAKATARPRQKEQASFWNQIEQQVNALPRPVEIRGAIYKHLWPHWFGLGGDHRLERVLRGLWSLRYDACHDDYERALGVEGGAYFRSQDARSDERWPDHAHSRTDDAVGETSAPEQDRGLPVCGIMTMARYGVPELLRRDAKAILFRTMLAAELFPIIILPVPDETARSAIKQGMIPPPLERLTQRGEPSSRVETEKLFEQNLLLTGNSRGVIVISTPTSIISDLFEPM